MAFVSKEKKAKIAAALKIVLKNTNIKYSLSVHNHSKITMTIRSVPKKYDFIKNLNETMLQNPNRWGANQSVGSAKDHVDINPHWYQEHYTGDCLTILTKIVKCLNIDNFDNSDSQSDYFHVGHYIGIKVGNWDKPVIVVG